MEEPKTLGLRDDQINGSAGLQRMRFAVHYHYKSLGRRVYIAFIFLNHLFVHHVFSPLEPVAPLHWVLPPFLLDLLMMFCYYKRRVAIKEICCKQFAS